MTVYRCQVHTHGQLTFTDHDTPEAAEAARDRAERERKVAVVYRVEIQEGS